MELTPTQIAALQTLTVSSGKMPANNLSVGQQLLAKVISLNSASGEVTLNINNTLLNAKTTLPLKTDQILQLLVAQTGKQITLQLPEKLISSLVTEQAMRQTLPQQKPIGFAIQQIQNVIKHAKPLQIPQKLVQVSRSFIKQLPTTKQLSTAEGVKSAIKNSGLLLEKNLKDIITNNTASIIKKDLKSLLINFKNALSKEQSTTQQTTKLQNNPIQQETKLQNSSTQQTIKLQSSLTQQPQTNKLPPQQPLIKASISNTQAKTPLDNQVIQTNTIKNTEQVKQEAALQIKTNSENKTINTTQATTKSVENIAQQIKIEQTQQAIKVISQQHKIIPKELTKVTTQKPLVQSLLQQPITNTPQISKTVPTYNKEFGNIKHALDFVATKTDPKQSNVTPRISSLVDMIDNLVKSVDSAISRTQLHQLNTLQEQDNGKLAWSMEIPAQDGEDIHLIQMRYEKEQATEQEADAVVTVNLAIELESLGPIHARITLISENIGVVLWAERDDTYEITRQNVNKLQENLQKSGFKSENIACHQGKPPLSHNHETINSSNLVDLKA